MEKIWTYDSLYCISETLYFFVFLKVCSSPFEQAYHATRIENLIRVTSLGAVPGALGIYAIV